LVTTLEQVFRDQWGRVLAALVGFLGDFDLAEEAAQEAFAIAAERWPRDGPPANPGAWLVTTARNRAINRIRRDRTLAAKTRLLQVPQAAEDTMDATAFPDERLELIFTCCHPALATEAQVALTLRTLGGLTTGEIAHAFLVPEPTMAQRLVRGQAQDQGRRMSNPNLRRGCPDVTRATRVLDRVERAKGIEPSPRAWEALSRLPSAAAGTAHRSQRLTAVVRRRPLRTAAWGTSRARPVRTNGPQRSRLRITYAQGEAGSR
jgi:RNA polymerase sigma factor (sigma-70 family)